MMRAILIMTLLLSPVAQAQIVRPAPRIVRILPESNVRSTLRRVGAIQRDQLPPHAYSPRQGQPYTSIGPHPTTQQRQDAARAAREEAVRRCQGAGCPDSQIRVGQSTRADGMTVVEHAEAECITCGASAGAQRSLRMDPPYQIESRTLRPFDARPARGVAGDAARDASQALQRRLQQPQVCSAPPCFTQHPECVSCSGTGWKRAGREECPSCKGEGYQLCAACRRYNEAGLEGLKREEALPKAERRQRMIDRLTRSPGRN